MALPLLIHPALRLLGLASFAFADTQIVESETRELQQRIASLEAQLAACHSMNAVGSAVNGIAPPESSPLSTSSTTSASLSLTGRHEGTRAASAQSLHQACGHVHLSASHKNGTTSTAGARRLLGSWDCDQCKEASACYSLACTAGKMRTDGLFASCAQAKGACDLCYPESECGARPPGVTLPPARILPEWGTHPCTWKAL